MAFPLYSPTGKRVVPYEGPLDARVVVIAESPAQTEMEKGRPLVGRAGQMWSQIHTAAGFPRSEFRILNVVPCRAPHDKFAQHDPADLAWGRELLFEELHRAMDAGAELIMPMGNNPLLTLFPQMPAAPRWHDDESKQSSAAEKSRIGIWRGSLFHYDIPPVDVETYFANLEPDGGVMVLPTYHPSAIARQYKWHPWGVIDFKKARAFLDGRWEWPKKRTWFRNRYDLLPGLVDRLINEEHVVSIDTESSPWKIVALVTRDEVHHFAWDPWAREPLRRLLASDRVVKIAQNAGHDWTFFHDLGIEVKLPHIDVGGQHQIISGAGLARNLSPAIATKWTTYPYHKFLVEFDPQVYCGLDTCIPYDALAGQQAALRVKRLEVVNEHDHSLLMRLLHMQWHGVLIDEEARVTAVKALTEETAEALRGFQMLAEQRVLSELVTYQTTLDPRDTRFEKPHLFFIKKQCKCCGGGKTAKDACWRCAGFEKPPLLVELKELAATEGLQHMLPEKPRKADYMELLLTSCRTCGGEGKVGHWREVNPESDDQLKDILYKGFRIPVRRFKRKVTVRVAQLFPLLDGGRLNAKQHQILTALVGFSKVNTDRETMVRLQPDIDGLLHCVFDPWGTGSGRVASKGGLIQVGTNIQNIAQKHRYVIIPRPGKLFVAPDYSGIEGRNVAVISNDPGMRRAFTVPIDRPGHEKHGMIDSHTILQLAVLDHLGLHLTRDQCKILGYGGMYGGGGGQIAKEMTAKAFAKGVGDAVSDADGIAAVALLLQVVWPGLMQWHKSVEQALRADRKLTSPTGRVREWVDYIVDPKTRALKSKIHNEGLSFFPQDMGAWVLALGLEQVELNVDARLATACIHVHDEGVFEIPATPGRLTDEAVAAIARNMPVEQWGMPYPIDDPVPLHTWKEAKDG